MIFLRANITDAAVEKHVPVVSVTDEGVVVKIGSVEHPMATEHFIEWIQLRYSNKSCRFYLRPGGRPEAFFPVGKITDFEVREYCNLHGLWSKEVK
jgi:superoxide reductase